MTHFSYLSNNVSLELTELDKIETKAHNKSPKCSIYS